MKTATVCSKLMIDIEIDHNFNGLSIKRVINGANSQGAIVGFGITQEVPLEWFEDWILTAGSELPAIKSGAIFVQDSLAKAKDEAKEKQNDPRVATGLDPIDPEKPAVGITKVKN